MTASEKEEDRLLNGQQYTNFPEGWRPEPQTLPPVTQSVIPPINIQGIETGETLTSS